jgi:hypothetical protein
VPFNNLITVTVMKDPNGHGPDTLSISPDCVAMPAYTDAALVFQINQPYDPGKGWRFPVDNYFPDQKTGLPTSGKGHSSKYWNGFRVPDDTSGREFIWIVPLGPDRQFLLVVDRNNVSRTYKYCIKLEFHDGTQGPIYSDPTIKNRSDGKRWEPELEHTA